MALALKPNKLCRNLYTSVRHYCEKSIYQKEEEGSKPRTVYGKHYPDWRTPWIKRDGEFKSKLSVFVERNPSPDILSFMSQVPDLTLEKVKTWWSGLKIIQEKENQRYLPERVSALGANLAAIHFFTYRLSAVRLKDSKDWIAGDITTLNLPNTYEDGYFVEAIDCTNFHHNGMRYEGIQNLSNLSFLKWLSLKNNRHIDLWCLDRLAGQNGDTLEFLDISGCQLCPNAVFALSRMKALRFLVITDPGDNMQVQAALSVLEQERPNLLIKIIESS